MSRRSVSSVLALVLLVLLIAAAALLPVPYVVYSPGVTQDLLAENRGREIVQVRGRRTYPTNGELELTTVSVTSPDRPLNLGEALAAWFDRTRALYPRDVVYGPEQSTQDIRTESAVQMVSSQDTAIAAALTQLGYDVPVVTEVLAVTPGAPAEGRLRVRDRILAVNGSKVGDARGVVEALRGTAVGESATFLVRRDRRTRTIRVPTRAAQDDPRKAVVGVLVGEGYNFPFDVSVNIDERIGGPSAGLMFALAVYDRLTPGALTGGRDIAGTGTITADGTVGPIGGIQQKIVGAADAGAVLFLVPPGNCDAALGAPVDEEEITLVKAPTLGSAVRSVRGYVRNRRADLPRCG